MLLSFPTVFSKSGSYFKWNSVPATLSSNMNECFRFCDLLHKSSFCTALRCILKKSRSFITKEDGGSMTAFYYYSVNHQSGLERNTFSKLSYIFVIHQNVPQIMSFHLRYGFIGQKILELWRQESWPFGPGWSANMTSINRMDC